MNIENKRIEDCLINGEGAVSRIVLDHLAIPETVRVFFLGEEIIPIRFDFLGNPIFSYEQSMLLAFKRSEFIRRNGICPDVQVHYKERSFDVPMNEFDTLQSIKKSLHSLSAFENVIKSRRMFAKSHSDAGLKEFIVFGRLRLMHDGKLGYVCTDEYPQIKEDVEEVFRNSWYLPSDIPSASAVCPCCGKPFTIEDVKNGTYEFVDHIPWHIDCWHEYRRQKEIYKVINCLMDYVYEPVKRQCQYELLPNGYYKDAPHIPWFLYHTPDGDIIVGWRKRVISLEWQENFKAFDFEKLFSSENATKWQKNGKRGIHACGEDKAAEYLWKVLKAVNP